MTAVQLLVIIIKLLARHWLKAFTCSTFMLFAATLQGRSYQIHNFQRTETKRFSRWVGFRLTPVASRTPVFLFTEVQLIYKVLLVSSIQQSDSIINIYYIYMFFFRFFSTIEYSKMLNVNSLCYPIGPRCLSIISVNPKLLMYPSPLLSL